MVDPTFFQRHSRFRTASSPWIWLRTLAPSFNWPPSFLPWSEQWSHASLSRSIPRTLLLCIAALFCFPFRLRLLGFRFPHPRALDRLLWPPPFYRYPSTIFTFRACFRPRPSFLSYRFGARASRGFLSLITRCRIIYCLVFVRIESPHL